MSMSSQRHGAIMCVNNVGSMRPPESQATSCDGAPRTSASMPSNIVAQTVISRRGRRAHTKMGLEARLVPTTGNNMPVRGLPHRSSPSSENPAPVRSADAQTADPLPTRQANTRRPNQVSGLIVVASAKPIPAHPSTKQLPTHVFATLLFLFEQACRPIDMSQSVP